MCLHLFFTSGQTALLFIIEKTVSLFSGPDGIKRDPVGRPGYLTEFFSFGIYVKIDAGDNCDG